MAFDPKMGSTNNDTTTAAATQKKASPARGKPAK
jgi:hypothetical protein